MNRERREQYEQGDMGYSGHSVSESHPRFRLVFTHSSAFDTDQATATKGAVFLRTLLFCSRFSRVSRLGLPGDAPFFVRGFRVFRGENSSGHSVLET